MSLPNEEGLFTGWGPFADRLSDAERTRRLERLAAATWGQGPAYAGLCEAVILTKQHPRNIPSLPTRFNALPEDVQVAIQSAYKKAA